MASTEAEWPRVGDDDLKTISTSQPSPPPRRTRRPQPGLEPARAREHDHDPAGTIPPPSPSPWRDTLGYWLSWILFSLTSFAVVSVSAWLLLPYWLLIGWILFGAVGRSQKDEPAPTPAPCLVLPDDNPVDASVPEPLDLEPIQTVEAPPPAKPKRPRSRSKGKTKALAETPRATWVRVGPGKFVRVESPEANSPPIPFPDDPSPEGEAPAPDLLTPLEPTPECDAEGAAGLPVDVLESGPAPDSGEEVVPDAPPPDRDEDTVSSSEDGVLELSGPSAERLGPCPGVPHGVLRDVAVQGPPIRRAGFPRLAASRISGHSPRGHEDFGTITAEWLRPRREVRSDRPEPRTWLRGFSRRLRRGIATRAPPRC